MSDLIPTIQNAAIGPKSFREDNTEGVAQNIKDLIDADVYVKANASPSRGFPFRTVRTKGGNNAGIDFCDAGFGV